MNSRLASLLIVVVAVLGIAASGTIQWVNEEVRAHVHKDSALGITPSLPAESMLGGFDCLDHDDDASTPNLAADLYPCDGVDLLSYIPTEVFSGDTTLADGNPLDTQEGTDMWGWTDPLDGTEYVLMGKTNGVAFFDITDPTDPAHIASLDNTSLVQLLWHDIKVYEDHAYIVSESNYHGVQIVDLTRLRDLPRDGEPAQLLPDSIYAGVGASHNIVINEDTGYAYAVGSNVGLAAQDPCRSGLHMIDIRIPDAPVFAGCYLQNGGSGQLPTGPDVAGFSTTGAYVHDAQCVTYHGPDADHDGREICFMYSEDRVVIADVTVKAAPTTLSVIEYEGASYTHQGWLTEDHRFMLFNDETDESGGFPRTRTFIMDLQDLDNPGETFAHIHHSNSIDHNLYTHGGAVYQSHYSAGLRISDLDNLYDRPLVNNSLDMLDEVAYFDVHPEADINQFLGTWSNYPYFDSGVVAISGYEGLWLVRVHDDVLAEIAD